MRLRIVMILAILTTLFLGGQTPVPLQRENLQQQLNTLTKRGYTYRLLDNNLIELTDPLSGEKHLKSLREPSDGEIRSWAAQRGIPILEIDPSTIDTNRYTGWYRYWTTVPLGNSFGNPLIVGDVNHNGQPDVYGSYKDTLTFDIYESRVYEIDTSGSVFRRHQYRPWPGASRQISDADADSLMEVAFSYWGLVSGYEQHSRDSLPIHRTFEHQRYGSLWSGSEGIYIGNLDGDSLTDFLYQGTSPDSIDTNLVLSKTFVAEYDPALQTFVRVWSTQFRPGSGAVGFSVGDFNNNGKMKFVASHGLGEAYMAENTGDNDYALIWQDSTGLVNFFYHGCGDADNDGLIEFFVGATLSNGNWVVMYEADEASTTGTGKTSQYSAKLLFHLFSGGLLAVPIYTVVDIDGDGRLELVMVIGSDLYVFKSRRDNLYYLWYFRRENLMEAIAFYDFNRDGRMDFISSKAGINRQNRLWFYADIYLATSLVGVSEQDGATTPDQPKLFPSYPNPFNPSTTIRFSLPSWQHVVITIYDLLGRRIETVLDGDMESGTHSLEWNAAGRSSGVYLVRLNAAGTSLTNKLLLIR